MRWHLPLAAGLLLCAFAAPAPLAEGHVGPSAQPRVARVVVDVRCPGQGVQFGVEPWTVVIRQGDEVEWVLAPTAAATSLAILSRGVRDGGPWPFAEGPPYRGNRQAPPRARRMRPNQAGRQATYAIELDCVRADGSRARVVIDPDIIIRGA